MSGRPKLMYQISVEPAETENRHTEKSLHVPDLHELKAFFEEELSNHFKISSVEVCDCPDLREWGLAAPGISGNSRLIQCGDWQEILDPSQASCSTFSISQMAQSSGEGNLTFVFGHAASAPTVVGGNADVIPNTRIFGNRHSLSAVVPKQKTFSRSRSISRRSSDDSEESSKQLSEEIAEELLIERYPSDEIGGYGALYACDGETAPVLHIQVEQRFSDMQFPAVIRHILKNFCDIESIQSEIALGGCFKVQGSVEGCTMPSEYPKNPVTDKTSKKLFEVWQCTESVTCFTTLIANSHHDDSFNLSLESTSAVSSDMCFAGRFLGDLTQSTVYDAYFSIGQAIHMFQAV